LPGNCDAVNNKKCLRVRWGEDSTGNYFVFQDSIINFTYQPGINYKLKVERVIKPGIPADSVAYQYILKDVLAKRMDSGLSTSAALMIK